MGNAYDFKCPMCHFETTCSKGIDRGFRIQVEPMYCTQCKVLKNIVMGNYVEDYSSTTQFEPIERICKKCETGEYLTKWNTMDCPSCGHFRMKHRRSDILWD